MTPLVNRGFPGRVRVATAAAFLAVSPIVSAPALADAATDAKTAAAAAAAAAANAAEARPSPSVEGDWLGALDVQGQSLHLAIHLTRNEDGSYAATLDSLDQGAKGIKIDKVGYKDGVLTLELSAISARYEGAVGKDGAEIAGTWSQGPGSLPLKFTRGKAPEPPAAKAISSDPIKPLWMGSLEVPGGKLRLVVHLARGADGVITATLDSLDQGANGLKVDSAVFKDGKLTLDLKSMGARFEGTSNKEGTEVTGQWIQGGAPMPLVLKVIDKMPAILRPQEPKPPLPYTEEEVAYVSAPSSVKIACTLTRPRSDAPIPAVVLITGSGPEDRNETVFGHRPFLVLADHLTRKGIAVLRCDDRGVGGSSAGPADATSDSYADDALAGVAYLKTRKEIDPARIGLCGHSEGGLVAPLAAARSKDVAFIVLLAGPGVPGSEIILDQTRLIMKAEGASDAEIEKTTSTSAKVFAAVREEKDPKLTEARVRKELAASPEGLTPEQIDRQTRTALSPWFRYFLTYDPAPTLSKVEVPVLALNGERDLQVPAAENTKAIRTALDSAGHKDYKVQILPGLNHLFQEAHTGSPTEYASIEQTFAPSALTMISDWILAHAKHITAPAKEAAPAPAAAAAVQDAPDAVTSPVAPVPDSIPH
jgi:pimeloyl-ACP methyl ester carboxylesterase